MLSRLLEQIKRERWLASRDRVVVAVSGGVDSIVLLEVLLQLRRPLDLFLHVAHLDHGLRQDAAADAAFTCQHAQQRGLGCTLGTADVSALARQNGQSFEAAARRARYGFLQRVAREQRCNKIALGHHKNDQVETFFLNALRGAGLRGMGGMQTRNGPYVRPLLGYQRSEILAYARQHKLPFHQDPSNEDVRFRRNWVRHRLIPTLEHNVNPNVIETVWRGQNHLRQAADYLQQQARRAFLDLALERCAEAIVLDRHKLVALHPALQGELVRFVFLQLAGDLKRLTSQHVDAIAYHARQASSGQTLELPRGWRVEVEHATLRFRRSKKQAARPSEQELDLSGKATRWGQWTLSAKLDARSRRGEIGAEKGDVRLSARLDWGTIAPPLVVRSRRPGDRIDPLGLGGHKKIQDLFVDAKLSRALRDNVPIVQDQQGIVWVAGYAQSERTQLSARTRQVLNVVATKDTSKKD